MRGRVTVVWALSAVASLASVSVATAGSHPQERHGFWIGLGGGVGSAKATCDDCGSGNRETGAAGYLKLGGTLNEHLLLGAEVNVWTKKQEGVTLTLSSGAVTLTLYPEPASGFFLKGGVGLSMVDTQFREGSTTVTIDPGYGLGVLAGAGYDLRVGRNVSITPAVNRFADACTRPNGCIHGRRRPEIPERSPTVDRSARSSEYAFSPVRAAEIPEAMPASSRQLRCNYSFLQSGSLSVGEPGHR